MPVLPKHHDPLRLETACILLSPDHSGNLYDTEDIAYAINDAADVTNNPSVSTKVDATALIRAFAPGTNMCCTSAGEQDEGETIEAANILFFLGVLFDGARRGGMPMLFGGLAPPLWRTMFVRVWFAASLDPKRR